MLNMRLVVVDKYPFYANKLYAKYDVPNLFTISLEQQSPKKL